MSFRVVGVFRALNQESAGFAGDKIRVQQKETPQCDVSTLCVFGHPQGAPLRHNGICQNLICKDLRDLWYRIIIVFNRFCQKGLKINSTLLENLHHRTKDLLKLR